MTRKPKKNGHDGDYGGQVLDSAIGELTGGVNLEAGTNAVNSALEALQKQAKALAKAEYDTTKPELVGRTFAYTAKVIDETMRLIAFSKGGPDSRIETQAHTAEQAAMDVILQSLTKEQFETLYRWKKEAEERET
ncbi:MAG: hypothetical protein V3T23_11525 [Nitrososphaerales archaeon]